MTTVTTDPYGRPYWQPPNTPPIPKVTLTFNPPTSVDNTSPILALAADVNERIGDLSRELGGLEDQILPILRPARDSIPENPTPPTRGESTFSGTLTSMLSQLAFLYASIVNLRERIEI